LRPKQNRAILLDGVVIGKSALASQIICLEENIEVS
jgi:hypothetical protein